MHTYLPIQFEFKYMEKIVSINNYIYSFLNYYNKKQNRFLMLKTSIYVT